MVRDTGVEPAGGGHGVEPRLRCHHHAHALTSLLPHGEMLLHPWHSCLEGTSSGACEVQSCEGCRLALPSLRRLPGGGTQQAGRCAALEPKREDRNLGTACPHTQPWKCWGKEVRQLSGDSRSSGNFFHLPPASCHPTGEAAAVHSPRSRLFPGAAPSPPNEPSAPLGHLLPEPLPSPGHTPSALPALGLGRGAVLSAPSLKG